MSASPLPRRRLRNRLMLVFAGFTLLLAMLFGLYALPFVYTVDDRLFDTLDTTTRLLTVSDTLDVVISDTVGFIRKLPHQLVEAFKATLEELDSISGIGPVTARKILDYRQRIGMFSSVDQLLEVSGIGVKTLEKMRAKVTV